MAAGLDIRIDGSTVIDIGTTKPKTLTGLASGLHSFEIRRRDDSGIDSEWSSLIYAYLIDEVAIRLDAGRTAGGVVGGYDVDVAYSLGTVGTNDFGDTVDISGLTDPAPASAYSTNRILNADPITFQYGGLVPSRTYLLRCHFNEGNASHVLGNSVMVVKVNTVELAPIRDSAYRNSKYFDVSERAGGFHKGYIREYLATANGSGIITVVVTNAVNNDATDVRIAAIDLLEAPPVASFTSTPPSNQIFIASFTDTSTGEPTSWLWSFGDGSTSTLQNPGHNYAAAGDYTVTLVATNRFGDSETATETVTVPSLTSLTVTPSSLTAVTQGVSGSQNISATGGTGPYTVALVSEASDARDYTSLGGELFEAVRRGALPNGLSLSSSGVLSGTPNLSAVKPSLIILEGDSIIRGSTTDFPGYDSPYTPGGHLAKLLPRSWRVRSIATGGETFQMMASEYPTQAQPHFDSAYERCIYFLSSGHNDLLAGTTLADMKTYTNSCISQAKADGFQTIVATIVPSPYYGGGTATIQSDYNTWVRGGGVTDADVICDYSDNVLLANQHHNTYFESGGIHNTELGYMQRAVSIKTAIDALPTPGDGSLAVDYKFAVKVTDSLGNAATKQYTLTINP
jgi:PKD repeat protein